MRSGLTLNSWTLTLNIRCRKSQVTMSDLEWNSVCHYKCNNRNRSIQKNLQEFSIATQEANLSNLRSAFGKSEQLEIRSQQVLQAVNIGWSGQCVVADHGSVINLSEGVSVC